MTEAELKAMPFSDRLDFLKTHADHITDGEYFKAFDDAESAGMKDNLATLAINLSKMEADFEVIKEQYKAQVKPLKTEYGKTLHAIRQNGEFEEGETYLFADQVAGQMQQFDKFGNLVGSRRLKPEERQISILSANSN